MLDIKWIRTNPQAFKAAMIKRGLASAEHPTNIEILAKEGNPDNQDDKLKALLKHSDEVYIEKIQPIEALDIKRRDLISKTESLPRNRNDRNVARQNCRRFLLQ